jgi:glutamate/tyrosine decarboxylase-like PLP-dependent enzyme
MGGFLLPYLRRAGAPVPRFEFDVPGVTSISMDFHKYAFAAKGASVILHRNKDLRRYQIYACSNWTGYTVINPTVQSTKSAGPVAAAWAALHFIGDAGYLEFARQVLGATRRIAAHVDASPDLRLLGRPEMNLVAFTSDTVSVFHVIDEMKTRGWYIQPQLGYGDSKENIHLSINPASVRWVDALLADLDACVAKAKSMASRGLAASIKAAFGDLDPDTLGDDTFQGLLAMAGVQRSALPGRMAEVNEVLNALPVPMRERLLVEYLNELFRQPE